MKKTLSLIGNICFILVIITLLAACAKPAPTATTPAATTPAATKPAATTPAATTPAATKPAATTPAPQPKAEVIKWKFADHMARDSDRSRHQQDMLKAIVAMSNGRIQFQYFGAGELLASAELADAVSKGVVQMEHCGNYWAGILGDVANLEGGACNFLAMEQGWAFVESSGLLERLREIYTKDANVYYIFPTFIWGWGDNVYSRKPLKGPEDLKGLPFRTSGITSQVLANMGAATVWLAWEELYTALQMGTVEACEWGNFALMWGMGLQDVAKYWYKVDIGSGQWLATVAYQPAWNSLPKDMQEIILGACIAYTAKSSSYVLKDDLKVMADIKKKVTFESWLDPARQAPFAAAWKQVMDKMGNSGGKYCKEVYDIIKNYRIYMGAWPQ